MAGGRPTKYDPEFHHKLLIDVFKKGHFVPTFCAEADIVKDTFWRWIKEHKEFSDVYKKAKDAGEKYYTSLLQGLATGNKMVKGGNVTAAIYLTKVGLKWRDDEVEPDPVEALEFYE